MNSEREVSLIPAVPAASIDRIPETADFVALRCHAAAMLRQRATDIASRWESQARTVMPDAEASLEFRADLLTKAVALIQSFGTALAADGATSDDAVGLGLAFGSTAFGSGAMLHHMLKALDLLVAMCLFGIEDGLCAMDAPRPTATDGIRICRRLQRTSSLSTLAAARGYSLAATDATREQFRRLRHDMRNPLGTIQSALALMEDDTVPEEARQSPRFRMMIRRNARALDDMIVQRLGDVEARSPAGAFQTISLRAIACAVRRDLRAEAEVRGVTLVVSNDGAFHRLDAAGVELLLHDLLLSAIHQARDQAVLTIEFGERSDGRVSIDVVPAHSHGPILGEEALHRLGGLATRLGAWLEVTDDRITLAFPVMLDGRIEERRGRTVSNSVGPSVGKTSDDLGGAHQGDDRESRAR